MQHQNSHWIIDSWVTRPLTTKVGRDRWGRLLHLVINPRFFFKETLVATPQGSQQAIPVLRYLSCYFFSPLSCLTIPCFSLSPLLLDLFSWRTDDSLAHWTAMHTVYQRGMMHATPQRNFCLFFCKHIFPHLYWTDFFSKLGVVV